MSELRECYDLYKLLRLGKDSNIIEVFDKLETVSPMLTSWVELDFLDMSKYVSDDTTSGRALNLKNNATKLKTLVDKILFEYLGISDEEYTEMLVYMTAVCEDLAVIRFSTDNYSTYINDIGTNTFNLENIEMTNYVTVLAAQGAGNLIDDIKATLEIFIDFKTYLPEYSLSEEDYDTIFAALDDAGRGSYEIGTINEKEVNKLSGN